MTNPIVFIPLAVLLIFLLGVLVGNGYTTHEQDQRDRHQAARQRDLNAQYRALREYQEAAEEELLWLAKQQAGLTVLDHNAKEIPAQDHQPPRQRWKARAVAAVASTPLTSQNTQVDQERSCHER